MIWRDRKEMLISLLTPIILIIILGFMSPDWFENPSESLQMTVALVNEDDEEAGLEQLQNTISTRSIPEESAALLVESAERSSPITLLKQMFHDDQVEEFVETVELDAEAALQRLNNEEVAAIITIPEGFTHAALNKMLLDEGSGATLQLAANEGSLKFDVLHDLIDGFMQTLNFQTAIQHALGEDAEAFAEMEQTLPVGGFEEISGARALTSFQYFALAISILFALFLSMTIAQKCTAEKRERVFERILLTGSHPLRYLAGKAGSTFFMSMILITIILLVSHFILNLFHDRSLQFWVGVAVVMILFSLCVAALATVFTSLVFRMKDDTAVSLILSVVLLLGTVGGNFVPMQILPVWVKHIWEWTPNGLSLSVLIQWIQYDSNADLMVPLLKLMVFAVVVLSVGMWLFPKRGRI